MPKSNLPNRNGFLDGILYLISGFYVFYGLSWHLADPPSKIGYIPWFHESLNDDLFGTTMIVMGSVIAIVHTVFPTIRGRIITTSMAMLTGLIPGLMFVATWVSGYNPRGLVAGVPLLFMAVLTLWATRKTANDTQRDHDTLKQAREEGF